MNKSANEVMQEILFSAVTDAIAALRAASRGVPNNLLRDLNAVHPNTTFADLPAELQAAVSASVRSAFTRLLREGYSVSPTNAPPPRDPRPRPDVPRSGLRPGRPPARDGDAPGKGRPAGRRPNRKPHPRRP